MGDKIRKWIAVLLAGSILAMIQLVPAGGAVPPAIFRQMQLRRRICIQFAKIVFYNNKMPRTFNF